MKESPQALSPSNVGILKKSGRLNKGNVNDSSSYVNDLKKPRNKENNSNKKVIIN
jgi:hypothetical protein